MHPIFIVFALLAYFCKQVNSITNPIIDLDPEIAIFKRDLYAISSESIEIISNIERMLIETNIVYLKRAIATIDSGICNIHREIHHKNGSSANSLCLELQNKQYSSAFTLTQTEMGKCLEKQISDIRQIRSLMMEEKDKLGVRFQDIEVMMALQKQKLICTIPKWPQIEDWPDLVQKVNKFKQSAENLQKFQLAISEGLLDRCCGEFLKSIPQFLDLKKNEIEACIEKTKKSI